MSELLGDMANEMGGNAPFWAPHKSDDEANDPESLMGDRPDYPLGIIGIVSGINMVPTYEARHGDSDETVEAWELISLGDPEQPRIPFGEDAVPVGERRRLPNTSIALKRLRPPAEEFSNEQMGNDAEVGDLLLMVYNGELEDYEQGGNIPHGWDVRTRSREEWEQADEADEYNEIIEEAGGLFSDNRPVDFINPDA